MSDSTPTRPRAIDPNMILGSFEVESKIGVGSYATAYLARQRGTERKAVVKIAHPHLLDGPHGEAIRKRFEVELRASTRVRHPNVITVYTSGALPNGTPAIAMEYVEGVTLEQWLERNAPLEPHDFTLIFHQIASALQALHDSGIVHRDLAPRNMIINRRGTNALPHITLLDFGIAQLDGATHVTAGPIGTPQFMAPEQLRGETTRASDIFALGQLMWWAMTGEPLLNELKTQMEIFKYLANMEDAPLPTSEMRRYASPLVQMVCRILSPDPLKRPSADEIAAILSRHTGMPGDSAEWFAVTRPKSGQFTAPASANLLVFTHPHVRSLVHHEVLVEEMCEVTSAPLEHWERHHASISSSDLVFIPISDDSAMSRQIVSAMALLTERLPAGPKLLTYRVGSARRGTWRSLGATDALSLPEDAERLRDYIRRSIKENAQKSPMHVTAPETFNPDPLKQSLKEDSRRTHDLIETFIGCMPEWLIELEEHIEDHDHIGILRVAGSLSSHSMSVGAERIVEICRTLCHLPSSYDVPHAMHWVEELEREYKKLFQELIAVRRR